MTDITKTKDYQDYLAAFTKGNKLESKTANFADLPVKAGLVHKSAQQTHIMARVYEGSIPDTFFLEISCPECAAMGNNNHTERFQLSSKEINPLLKDSRFQTVKGLELADKHNK